MLVLSEGVVVYKDKLGETDLLVDFLTPKGKIRSIAKGGQKSKKRFLNLLEELNILRLHLRITKKGKIPILEKVDIIFIPESFWYDLSKYFFFSYLGEVLFKVSFQGLYTNYFNFIKEFIRFIDLAKEVSVLHKMFFELKMMKFLGWGPEFEICVKCGYRPKRIFYLSIKDGGLKCHECKEERIYALDSRQMEILKSLIKNSMNPEFFKEMREKVRLDGLNLEFLAKIVEDFFRYFLIFDLNSIKFLKNLDTL